MKLLTNKTYNELIRTLNSGKETKAKLENELLKTRDENKKNELDKRNAIARLNGCKFILKKIKHDNDELEKNNKFLERENYNSKNKLHKLGKEHLKLKETVAELEEKISELEVSDKWKTSSIENIKQELFLERSIKKYFKWKLEAKEGHGNDVLEILVRAKNSLSVKNKKLSKKIELLRTQKKHEEAKSKKMFEEVTKLRSLVKVKDKKIRDLEERNFDLTTLNVELGHYNKELFSEVGKKTKELSNRDELIDTLKVRNGYLIDKKMEETLLKESYVENCRVLKVKYKKLASDYEELKKENEEIHEEFYRIKNTTLGAFVDEEQIQKEEQLKLLQEFLNY